MGTSTNYNAPPSWSDLKGEVTRTVNSDSISNDVIKELLKSFIDHNGGARVIAHEREGSGSRSGGTVANGTAARNIAGRLGGFISDVNRIGWANTLTKYGWNDLIGLTVKEILSSLLDRLGGDSSHIDEVDARMALSQLQKKYFGDAETIEELEQKLSAQVNNIDLLLQEFFGFYLFEVFCRVFFERLVQRVGEDKAHSFLNGIRSFINSTLSNRMVERNISQVDWTGPEGKAITSDIMETTLSVFGG